jgi:hypothetical protein
MLLSKRHRHNDLSQRKVRTQHSKFMSCGALVLRVLACKKRLCCLIYVCVAACAADVQCVQGVQECG